MSAPVSLEREEFSRLWLVAAATYGVGDILTTLAIVQYSTAVTEANALVRGAIAAFGTPGFAALKLAVFGLAIGISVYAAREMGDRTLYYAPPVMLAVVGAFTTVYNLRLLIG